MAEKSKFVDRSETYLDSPKKQQVSKKGSTTTIFLAEDENQNTGTSVDGVHEDGTRKRRVSSTSWQVKMTSEITDQVQTGQKVTTMQFDVGKSGSISPGVDSQKSPSFVSSSSFNVGGKDTDAKVFGSAAKDEADPAEDYVFIESADFVDRTEITEVQEQQESVAPEAKKSYFAYLLDQNQAGAGGGPKGSPKKGAAGSNEAAGGGASATAEQKKKDDATLYERITYTPGLAIRSWAVEEMKTKKGDSPDRTEDAENNNVAAEGNQRSNGHQGGLLSPSESYRISQIFAVQETEPWEEEKLRKEREEFSIIDTLSMDDMMKMLGEHDRNQFESQVPDHFPITGIPSDSQFRSEMSTKTMKQEASTLNGGQGDDTASVTITEVKKSPLKSLRKEKRSDVQQSNTNASESNLKTINSQKESTITSSSQSSNMQFSQTSQSVKQIKTQGSTVEQTSQSVEQTSQSVKKIQTPSSTVQRNQIEHSVTDSPSVTVAALETCQSESVSSSLGQSSDGASQEMKMKFKSGADAEQSTTISTQSVQGTTSLEGGVTKIVTQKQTVVRGKAPKDEHPVEIERKFNITPDTESRIKGLGGKLMKEKTFTDIYYDDSDYTLTLSDCWLRKRDNKWEMKAASESMSQKDFATQYKEITKENEITKLLKNSLKISSKVSSLKDILKKSDLSEFATISTTRKSYELSGCSIDLDLTDHGFQVGEIEVMAPSASEVPSALKTIEDVAKRLGLSNDKKIPGKVDDYLRRHKPTLYWLLVNRSVLPSPCTEEYSSAVT